jgi:hypothetical protein
VKAEGPEPSHELVGIPLGGLPLGIAELPPAPGPQRGAQGIEAGLDAREEARQHVAKGLLERGRRRHVGLVDHVPHAPLRVQELPLEGVVQLRT